MKDVLPRRSFLQAAGLAAAGSLVTNSLASAGQAEGTASPRPRLLSGCCAYSYEKYLQSKKMTMEEFFLKAVELGVEGVDVTTYWLKSNDPAYLVSLRHLAFKHALPFSGAAIGTDMCQSDPAKRAVEIEKIKKWVDATQLLGASHLRVFGGELPRGATDEQGVEWTAETLKQACDYAAPKGTTLGIESHGGITSKATNIIAILRRVDSPYAGCNLDISNFMEDPYSQVEALVPFATHTHIRDFYGEPRKPLDLDRMWQLFAKGGYQGFMSVEYEGAEDAMTGVPKLVEKVKMLCRKYSTV
ncbi:MAG TPA: sugar phosphate isomerase/epimerase family protein [Terriglobia bacterium]|nr:sugar phosphate isomerase/epimerase family protein [Terriglobia bacterium]